MSPIKCTRATCSRGTSADGISVWDSAGLNRGVYRLALVRPSFSLGVRWVLGLAWVVRACGVLRDVCWACWRRARSREPAVARRDARPVRRLPDVEPYDDFLPSRWCHGGIFQSSGRSEALPATPTLPGRGARARQFPVGRSERRALPVATPPGPLRGRGRRPSGGARSAAPRGLPVS